MAWVNSKQNTAQPVLHDVAIPLIIQHRLRNSWIVLILHGLGWNARRSIYFKVKGPKRWMSSWAGEHRLGAMALLRCPWPASWTLTSLTQVRLCASHTKATLFISPSEAGVSRITPLWHAELYSGNGWRTEDVLYTPLCFIQFCEISFISVR